MAVTETGLTCPRCGDLNDWSAERCSECRTYLLLAEVTPAYGMREQGGYGIRGWRVHCGTCSYLSGVFTSIYRARREKAKHKCP